MIKRTLLTLAILATTNCSIGMPVGLFGPGKPQTHLTIIGCISKANSCSTSNWGRFCAVIVPVIDYPLYADIYYPSKSCKNRK